MIQGEPIDDTADDSADSAVGDPPQMTEALEAVDAAFPASSNDIGDDIYATAEYREAPGEVTPFGNGERPRKADAADPFPGVSDSLLLGTLLSRAHAAHKANASRETGRLIACLDEARGHMGRKGR